MNGFTIIWSAIRRRKGRSIFTWLSIVAAFILFGVLAAVRYGMLGQLNIINAERLVTNNLVARGSIMPLSYYDKIIAVPGVKAAIYFDGLQGFFKGPKHTFQVLFTNVHSVTRVFTEFTVNSTQLQTWFGDRQGAIAGPALAARMGWTVGETIPVQSQVAQTDGSTTWYFHLDGIYQTNLPSAYKEFFIGHYQYFNQSVADPRLRDVVFRYFERIDDPRNATRISNAIDAQFANSSPQTLTQPETQEIVSLIRQFGNISAIVVSVGFAVFFTLLLIVGNAQAQSVRERTAEIALLRALGFKPGRVMRLLVGESLLLLVSGAIVGLFLSWLVTHALYPLVGNFLGTFELTWRATGAGVILAIVFGILAALVPLWVLTRLRVAEALRKS
ncbi:MAG: FtsX-like permease family protein [Gammaproteobacteria bacterium]|nr:FtsX-like permease family protein [Gammaproteobacteria bacterium]MDE1888148.1 FtsX-like permease family protein [Gammaproteobacteria bacterium]MDE2024752.1 FtsX-like permease family protein [Gammaproteobacteria bacterium]MDE2273499.1 FtsX-like permease family protein [Gammaproteobacteria bacterium]